ncbi:hypothetical protein D9615_009241 [Tricholomella constricta]|uniref:Uncharacterized protein n=1 Tax=Tricholomella constricta TaxID=117010 RepID=A0A8H5GW94_9AGAR|nr:hypothetical protein D9615_009241 [Tricholomella constricta]
MADIPPTQVASMAFDSAYLSSRSLPTAPDGYYDWQIASDPAAKREGHARVTNLINKIDTFRQKGGIKPDLSLLAAFTDTVTHPTSVDDRKGAFAAGLGILARLDRDDDTTKKMNNSVIGTLYNTVPHPPVSYLGPFSTYREADGGGNSAQNTNVGRGGTPYSRSVQGKAGLPRHSLPDPSLVFDTILKRRDHQIHAGGMSSMIFAFASIVTHSLFRTDPQDMNINLASSYLDLSPLYGDNQAAQDKVRDKSAGRGFLFPDTFSEERLLFAPPATSALLVIFSRNHNSCKYIARRLLQINEFKKWSDPPPIDDVAHAIQDEELFQTARLINCGHFMSAIMGDYVAGFLGSSEGCNWNMDAFDVIDNKSIKVERGQGNHCSAEFNILYRWHATISEQDQKWSESVFRAAFGGKPFDEITTSDVTSMTSLFTEISSTPSQRVFAGLARGPDGKFSDDDLADVLQCATENPAGAFRGRGTPEVLRIAEVEGIRQARQWGLCTMNEFRVFLGLKPVETFEEWNPDPAIAGAARQLYHHVDNLELYTGLQAEATMPLTDGSRFACGYTTTRGVLGDAIALVRGDRFYTSDFTPANLTAWGFQDCQRDMNNGGFGGQIPKLLVRHLPRHYPHNSVYSCFPFFTPSKMKVSLAAQKLEARYTFDRPVLVPEAKILNTFTGIKHVFSDPSRFNVIYEKYGYGSFVNTDEVVKHDTDKAMTMHAVFPTPDSLSNYVAWYKEATEKYLKEKSFKYDGVEGTYVDITYVINTVSAHVSAEQFFGVTLKTKENPHGMFTEQEFFDMMATLVSEAFCSSSFSAMLTELYSVTFLTFDAPEESFALHTAAFQAGPIVGGLAAKSLAEAAPSSVPNFIGSLAAKAAAFLWPIKDKPSYAFLRRMAAAGRPFDAMLGNIMGIGIGASVNHAHAAVQVINFYLEDEQEKERSHIFELVQNSDDQSTELLRGYVREAMRLRPQYSGLWRQAAVDAEIPQGPGFPPLEVKAGERIWSNFRNAHLNPAEFPDPTTVDPRRPAAWYNLNGAGFHKCPGTTYAQHTIAEIVKVVFKLKNLRPAPGDAGKLAGFSEVIRGSESQYYLTRNGAVSTWPGSLHIVYDE